MFINCIAIDKVKNISQNKQKIKGYNHLLLYLK